MTSDDWKLTLKTLCKALEEDKALAARVRAVVRKALLPEQSRAAYMRQYRARKAQGPTQGPAQE
jgi:hypothetical protein